MSNKVQTRLPFVLPYISTWVCNRYVMHGRVHCVGECVEGPNSINRSVHTSICMCMYAQQSADRASTGGPQRSVSKIEANKIEFNVMLQKMSATTGCRGSMQCVVLHKRRLVCRRLVPKHRVGRKESFLAPDHCIGLAWDERSSVTLRSSILHLDVSSAHHNLQSRIPHTSSGRPAHGQGDPWRHVENGRSKPKQHNCR